MDLKFRPLKANEIDIRVGNVDKNKKWITLLLYKNARVDMDLLDETVGPENWKRSHTRNNANCVVSIYDDKKNEWISKEDCGTESNNDAQKGLASDSFKRACVNWGIGRELYTSPKIFLFGDSEKLKYDTYSVKEIEYNEGKEISRLSVIDKSGKVVFEYPKKEMKQKQITKEQIAKIHTLLGKNDALKEAIYKQFKVTSSKELTEEKANKMIKTLEEGIAKKKKESETK